MKGLINKLKMSGLTWKQRLIALYFVFSVCLLCIDDDSSIWVVVIVFLNFANAARLLKKIPLSKNH